MEIKSVTDGEASLLASWKAGDEEALRGLIERGQKTIFSLFLHLTGANRNTAYERTVDVFLDSLAEATRAAKGPLLLVLIRKTLEAARVVEPAPVFEETDLMHLPAVKRESARNVKEALLALPFDQRALLLLRDQANLSYHEIAAVLDVPEKSARTAALQARAALADKIEQNLDHKRDTL